MYLVKTVSIKDQAFIKEADSLMFLSKNLYNSALYIERQQFFTKRDQLNLKANNW